MLVDLSKIHKISTLQTAATKSNKGLRISIFMRLVQNTDRHVYAHHAVHPLSQNSPPFSRMCLCGHSIDTQGETSGNKSSTLHMVQTLAVPNEPFRLETHV